MEAKHLVFYSDDDSDAEQKVLDKMNELAESDHDWEIISIIRVGSTYEMFYFE